ncbi:uncharacterized protein LOC125646894 [Ostrea edulis]|uniref:uncharacterized protein LOC125646894 n=1 Tax=Ostrea edulis TaxID=37623 RepID=UPI0024AEB78F|nr:uncharacterized protein LOC125646894 [Ostrea edulis]XP_055997709.1 uncharacterized protein LOC125646894 [Ostrea edulis]
MTDLPLETGAVISSIPGMTASSTSSVLLSTITNMVSHASSLVNNATVSSESTTAFTGSTSESHNASMPWIANNTPHPLTGKDRTVLVTLIVMGVIVPSVFIFVIVSICYRQRRMVRKRREQMLLRNQQDFAMDELPYSKRGTLASGKL